MMWPTPISTDWKGKTTPTIGGLDLVEAVRRRPSHSRASISSAAASHASPSASPVSDWPKPTRGGSGPSSLESFAHYDPDSCSWRTCQLSFLATGAVPLETFSETWPRAGMTRNGIAFQRQPLAPLTDETGSGLWPTPKVSATRNSHHALTQKHFSGVALEQAVELRAGILPREVDSLAQLSPGAQKMWPTPKRADGERGGRGDLLAWIRGYPNKHWPTPTSRDHKDGSYCPNVPVNSLLGRAVWRTPSGTVVEPKSSVKKLSGRTPSDPQVGLADQVGGQLNPTWVEWLMGFPLGWTDLGPSATPSSRKSPNGSDADSSR
jgi:hypothetical protein